MNELTHLIKDGIVIKITDKILQKKYHVLVCQKCGKRAKIQNIFKLPNTCSKCKCNPYSGPEKRGRPKK